MSIMIQRGGLQRFITSRCSLPVPIKSSLHYRFLAGGKARAAGHTVYRQSWFAYTGHIKVTVRIIRSHCRAQIIFGIVHTYKGKQKESLMGHPANLGLFTCSSSRAYFYHDFGVFL